MKKLLKNIFFKRFFIWFLIYLIICFIGLLKPKAEIIDYKFIDYVSGSSPMKQTNFTANETYTYPRDYVLFNGTDRFFAFNYCANGPFDFSFPNDFQGVTSLVGYSLGGKCYVQGIEGYNYTMYFMAQNAHDAGNGNSSIMFNTQVHNRANYFVKFNFLSLTSVSSIPAGVQIPNYDGDFNTVNTKIDTVQQAVEEVKKAQNTTNSKLNSIEEETKKTNDTLKDDTVDNSSLNINDKSADLSSSPVSDLITLPIKLLNNIYNGFSGSCVPYNLGSLFGTDLIFPCINLESIFGSFLWGLIDSLCCIFLIYKVAMLFVSMWTKIITMKDVFTSIYTPGGGN